MGKIAKTCWNFLKAETVLCVAVVLAVASAFVVPPNPGYVSYIDWDTLALLFALMAVMKGFQKAGLFVYLGNQLLKRTHTSRSMLLVLVFLPFVCSMVITNDVSLITFVPFGFIVLRLANQERLLVPLVVLQTVAANLGSMLTPMGNPQNLYLYAQSGLGFGAFCGLMLPFVALSGILLALLGSVMRSQPIHEVSVEVRLGKPRDLLACSFGFLLCLLAIFDVLPPLAVAAVLAVFLLIAARSILRDIDYALLLTFAAFFVFIGNIGNVPEFQQFLASALAGRVALVAVLASQVISNVPAALLLSGFTEEWNALIVGCNLGGLGTLIASMASLISYKMVAREYPDRCRRYFGWFTLCNVVLLVILYLLSLLLG